MSDNNRFSSLSQDERAHLRAALSARQRDLEPSADPANPWQSADAQSDLEALARLEQELADADAAEELELLPDLLA